MKHLEVVAISLLLACADSPVAEEPRAPVTVRDSMGIMIVENDAHAADTVSWRIDPVPSW